jgi:uncharacterized membrane protein
MLYLLALLVPPLAILFAGRPVQALLNGLLWLFAIVLSVISLILPIVPGVVGWVACVVWAFLVVRARDQDNRDRRLIEEAVTRDRARRWG